MALLYLVTVLLQIMAGQGGTPEKGFLTSQVLTCNKLNQRLASYRHFETKQPPVLEALTAVSNW
ncbi:MAG: hypothetical protein ACR2OA_06995 [Rubripirellula sp.]|jgi:hypothetical protein